MSKVTKFFRDPALFFRDARKNKEELNQQKEVQHIDSRVSKILLDLITSENELVRVEQMIAKLKSDIAHAKSNIVVNVVEGDRKVAGVIKKNVKRIDYIAQQNTFPDRNKPTAILIGFSNWKKFMIKFLPEYNVIFMGHSPKVDLYALKQIPKLYKPTVFTWSYKFPERLQAICSENNIPLVFVEDGFIRSVGLGASKTRPLSLVFDRRAMHFDKSKPSDLEVLLESYDFNKNPSLMKEARQVIDTLITSGLSKYNFVCEKKISDLNLSPSKSKVLILGQVEDDLSIKYGSERLITGNELVRIAHKENPDSEILYRPHPESLSVAKPHYSNPKDVEDICRVLDNKYSLADCINVADKVYTVTSLAGFEAVLRKKKVILFGNPFYSGWGFTEDRNKVKRRVKSLSPEQVLAGAYFLYPKYYHPTTDSLISCSEAVLLLKDQVKSL